MISIIHLLVFTLINFTLIQDNTEISEIKKRMIIALLGYSIGISLSNLFQVNNMNNTIYFKNGSSITIINSQNTIKSKQKEVKIISKLYFYHGTMNSGKLTCLVIQ